MEALDLDAHNPGPMTGAGNHTWLVPGRRPTLVDAGAGDPRHVAALAEALGRRGATLALVLVTHGHPDHAHGVPALRARWPGVVVRKWPAATDTGHPGWFDQPLADGEIVEAGDDALEVVHTPGHAPDHVCFWHASSRTLFGGDLVIAGSSVIIPASHGGSVAAYLRSLDRVRALDPARILPGHGAVVLNPADVLTGYIAHRHAREAAIVRVLRDGVQPVEAIARAVYGRLPDDLVRPAQGNIEAHLAKLVDERRVRETPAGYELTDV